MYFSLQDIIFPKYIPCKGGFFPSNPVHNPLKSQMVGS